VTPATRLAKEFLIGQILFEADRENVPLSELERRMLEFSEVEKTPPNFAELNAEFESECDSAAYEEKIASLIRNRVAGLRSINNPDLGQWNEAVTTLAEEDHYLLVLIDMAKSSSRRRTSNGRPPYDRLKLIATAAAIIIGLMIIRVIAGSLGILSH
jgi:hypothetical protein